MPGRTAPGTRQTIEEYYTLAVIGRAGIGTPHMDGNTRWCTATEASAFQETFGSGQPGSYSDVDSCDALFLFGHKVAETQTNLVESTWELVGPGGPRCARPRADRSRRTL